MSFDKDIELDMNKNKFDSIEGECNFFTSFYERFIKLEKEVEKLSQSISKTLSNEDMDKVAGYINEKTIENLKRSMN